MSYSNVYDLNVDLKRSMTSVVPAFKQGESAVLRFRLFDNGYNLDMTPYTYSEIVHKLPSGKRIMGNLKLVTIDGETLLEYKYTGLEMSEEGTVEVQLTVQSATSSVAIRDFKIVIYENMSEGDLTYVGVLQELIAEVSLLKEELYKTIDSWRHVGSYNNSTQYYQHNVVEYQGSSWIALRDTKGNPPPTLPTISNLNWYLIAKKGIDGKDGVTVGQLTDHMNQSVNSVNGVHNIRYYNETLEVKVNGIWKEVTGGFLVPEVSSLTSSSATSGTTINVSWSNPTNSEFIRTELYASKTNLTNYTLSNISTVASKVVSNKNITSYAQNSNVDETWYFKAFTVHNVAGEKTSKGVTTTATAKDTQPPPTITNFKSISIGTNNITLSWINPTSSDFSKVVIRYSTDSYPSSISGGTNAYEGSGTSVNVTGLTQNTNYYFRAFTVDSKGNTNTSTSGQQILVKTNLPSDDTWTNIGSPNLIAGNMSAGYFGTVPSSQFFTGLELSTLTGMSEGVLQHSNVDWLKFSIDGKIIFKPMKSFRYGISWNAIDSKGCVFGTKTVTKNGITFKVRLMKGALTNPSKNENADAGAIGSEWNRLMLPIHANASTNSWKYPQYVGNSIPNWNVGFTDNDLLTNSDFGNGSRPWCQENITSDNGTARVVRGGGGVEFSWFTQTDVSIEDMAWSPVLEVVSN